MTCRIWAGRFVVILAGVLLCSSVVFAAAWSAAGQGPPQLAARAARPEAQAAQGAGLVTARDARGASSPAPAQAQSALLGDSFEQDAVGSNPPAGWAIADGRWDGVVDDGGRLVRHARGASYGHLVAGSSDWRDYAVSARVRPAPLSTGFSGVAARFQGRGDYYACGVYYGSAARLWRMQGGSMTLLDARHLDPAGGRFHDVRLVVKGSLLSCVVDDTVMLSATDGSFPTGRIALVASSDEAADFDDVNVIA